MAAISSRRFPFVEDRCLLLTNEEYCRKLVIPNNWVRIRIGLLACLNPNSTAAANIIGGTLFFGLCSGQTAPSSANNVTNFVGMSLCGNPALGSTRTWTYTANGNYPYFANGNSAYFFRRFNQVITSSAQTFAYSLPVAGAGLIRRRLPVLLDFTRQVGGSGAATFTAYCYTTASALATDFRPDHLLDGLDQVGAPTLNGQAATSVTNSTLTISDIGGLLDTICVYWGHPVFPLEVYAVGANVVTDGQYDALPSAAVDTLESYSVGTVTNAGTINQGFNWPDGQSVFYGTTNAGSQFGFASTSVGSPYDPFDFYVTGTASVLAAGSGWGGPSSFYGTSNPAPSAGAPNFCGTDAGLPYDAFQGYGTGITASLSGGTGWASDAAFYGTANLAAGSGFAGTAYGFPYDNFDTYGTGTATPAVLSGGLGWSSYGTIYSN